MSTTMHEPPEATTPATDARAAARRLARDDAYRRALGLELDAALPSAIGNTTHSSPGHARAVTWRELLEGASAWREGGSVV